MGVEPELSTDKINLQELVEAMEFTEAGLAEAMVHQASLLLKASKYRVQKMRQRMKVETDLNQIRTKIALLIRAQGSETKITEKYIEAATEQSPDVLGAQKAFNEARALEEWSKLLLDSFQMRGSMLKALVQLLGAEAATESGFIRAEFERMGISQLKEKVKARFPGPRK